MPVNDLFYFITFTLIIICFFVFALYWQNRKMTRLFHDPDKEQSWQILGQWLQEIRTGLNQTSDMINRQLHSTNQAINTRLDNTTQLLRLLNHDLGKVHEIGRQMRDFQQLFKTPKLRGKIGEQILSDLLYQILPRSNVKLQYSFPNGYIVDAVVITDKGLIPIDAKFPMENFLKAENENNIDTRKLMKRDFYRDVRRHIETVGKKYIQPQEGTLDFAVMYIPSESIYYQIINKEEIILLSQQKKILITSPNIFFYFLKVILIGMEGKRLETATRRIIQTLYSLQQDSQNISGELKVLTTHLNNAKNASDRVNNQFERFTEKLKEVKYFDNEEEF
ncbi:DNA recombination protein RmuC [candidate division KSB1 bacterium]|nr:DNA recombination protein RmuC [candidate division KSB1 bacterium]